MRSFDPRIVKALMKTMYLGLFMNTLGPIILMIVVVIARGDSFTLGATEVLPQSGSMQTLLYAAIALSLVDIIATFFIRKRLFDQSVCPEGMARQEYFEERVASISKIVFIFNASHSVYGLVLYFLGFPVEIMMLFVAVTLISYQFFRPRPKLLAEFFTRLTGEQLEI